MKIVPKTLPKSILMPLALTVAASATVEAIQKKYLDLVFNINIFK